MASNITLSAGVRQNLLSLQKTADLMGTTQNRLATGKKVNSALDNPTNFFTSPSLQSRAGDLQTSSTRCRTASRRWKRPTTASPRSPRRVESMQSTLRQARQDKSFKTASYTVPTTAPAVADDVSFSGGAVGTTAVNVTPGLDQPDDHGQPAPTARPATSSSSRTMA